GCLGPSPREATWAEYDLGSPRAALRAPSVPLAGLEVRAAPWLDTTAQLYRLRYADDFRRHRFAASRWAAPPAELLERFLQREILFAQADAGAAGCRLSIALDEFEQRFETQAISDMVLEARAQLVAPRGETVLAKQVFQIRHPATSPDAQSGVAAARAAVENLVEGLDRWLAELSRSRPAVMAACKRTEKK
ncbi:MAG: PqiC family protein, partial [Rhodocyclaceae bacterium]|nr:PqiC family protein [Rhodocyclaceae bacterium]